MLSLIAACAVQGVSSRSWNQANSSPWISRLDLSCKTPYILDGRAITLPDSALPGYWAGCTSFLREESSPKEFNRASVWHPGMITRSTLTWCFEMKRRPK